jgi:PadR family transcriptional regulator, regulatory protein PadR
VPRDPVDGNISSYYRVAVRRKPGALLDLEARILGVAVAAQRQGRSGEVHGFAVARELADGEGSHRLTSHGTLYKALARLEDGGLLESRWEDHRIAEREGRPRRRMYRITGAGQLALARYEAERPTSAPAPEGAWRPAVEPS